MGLCGQRLVQDKNLNPPDDRKYVILVRVREEKAVAIPARRVKRSTPFVLDNAEQNFCPIPSPRGRKHEAQAEGRNTTRAYATPATSSSDFRAGSNCASGRDGSGEAGEPARSPRGSRASARQSPVVDLLPLRSGTSQIGRPAASNWTNVRPRRAARSSPAPDRAEIGTP
jgi:hypothetical protein